jgi:hypothetical protein
MPVKASGRATNPRIVDRWDGGAGWIAYPDEGMQRTSHLLATPSDDPDAEDDVWVVDPVDADGIDDLFAEYGDVKGVVVIMDRHARDSAAVADRHDVPIYVPDYIDPELDVPTERLGDHLPGTDYEVVQTVGSPFWGEAALYDGETLVVGDLVGTADAFLASGERLGVNPMLRVKPPSALRQFTPDRILTGHGEALTENATDTLHELADGARRRAPSAWLNAAKGFLS